MQNFIKWNCKITKNMKNESKKLKTILWFCQQPKTKLEIAEFLGMKTIAYAMARYVTPLLKEGQLKVIISVENGKKEKKYVIHSYRQ